MPATSRDLDEARLNTTYYEQETNKDSSDSNVKSRCGIRGPSRMFGGKHVFLLIISTLVIIQDVNRCWVTADELPIQHGVLFVGVGYNMIDGNPEGGDLQTGGVDPGILISRRIFKFTYDQGQTTSDLTSRIPDEISFVRRDSAFSESSLSTFHGTKSYASKLAAQVEVTGGYEGVMAEVQFAASARYQQVADKTSGEGSVFLSNETITNLGQARYRTELALTGKHLLSPGFVAAACRLPQTYTEADYMEFMEDWGTHVIEEANLGIREGENLEEKRSSFVNYAAQNVEGSISASGAYAGFSASLSVDMESFNSAMDSETKFGSSSSKYRIGTNELNEPISLKLIAMPEIFVNDYWTGLDDYISEGHCTASFDLESVKQNMDQALSNYGEWREIDRSTNPVIQIPLTWPDGVYGLPKPYNGCPTTDWDEGSRIRFYGPKDERENKWSNVNLFAGYSISSVYSRQEFCIKTVSSIPGSRWQWQPGSYCIYQFDSTCPQSFTSSSIDWGYPDNDATFGMTEGVQPSGTDTAINFCCRNDNVVSQKIHLPVDSNFMLLSRFGKCQMVHGMSVKKESIYWPTDGKSIVSGDNPSDGLYNQGVRLIYCYYYHSDSDIQFSRVAQTDRFISEHNRFVELIFKIAAGEFN
ncbi:uncharacterized protein LOC756464 isoform X1 [Strongylocentrotus purpuratus]|uniref:MACPF domain-containing protein n=2 Tax=Strongylocentrotus purpuratus TaxID=7668 RepID=A0A7M7HHB6_STRPU|nr:uncharacterized protein LOC756464 isoform X1 [Strongylocentrotus purpuratus]